MTSKRFPHSSDIDAVESAIELARQSIGAGAAVDLGFLETSVAKFCEKLATESAVSRAANAARLQVLIDKLDLLTAEVTSHKASLDARLSAPPDSSPNTPGSES